MIKMDEDDHRRKVLLREVLQQPVVRGDIHEGMGAGNKAVHVYLEGPIGSHLFACVALASGGRW